MSGGGASGGLTRAGSSGGGASGTAQSGSGAASGGGGRGGNTAGGGTGQGHMGQQGGRHGRQGQYNRRGRERPSPYDRRQMINVSPLQNQTQDSLKLFKQV